MTTRDQAIEAVSRKLHAWRKEGEQEDFDRWYAIEMARRDDPVKMNPYDIVSFVYDALVAAGVIPAEGTIPIARTTLLEWREVTDRLPCHLSEMIDLELWINTHDDAIPDAPTGEGEG